MTENRVKFFVQGSSVVTPGGGPYSTVITSEGLLGIAAKGMSLEDVQRAKALWDTSQRVIRSMPPYVALSEDERSFEITRELQVDEVTASHLEELVRWVRRFARRHSEEEIAEMAERLGPSPDLLAPVVYDAVTDTLQMPQIAVSTEGVIILSAALQWLLKAVNMRGRR